MVLMNLNQTSGKNQYREPAPRMEGSPQRARPSDRNSGILKASQSAKRINQLESSFSPSPKHLKQNLRLTRLNNPTKLDLRQPRSEVYRSPQNCVPVLAWSKFQGKQNPWEEILSNGNKLHLKLFCLNEAFKLNWMLKNLIKTFLLFLQY